MNEQIEGALPPCPICGEKAWKESTGIVVHLVRSTWCPLSVLAFDEKHWRIRSAPVVAPIVSGRADKFVVRGKFCDNGEHSHFELVNKETGEELGEVDIE